MGLKDTIVNTLRSIVSEEDVIKDKQLKEHTYTHLGGSADYFITPKTFLHVQEIVQFARKEGIAYTLLGNGSNLIIKDGGIRGIVICFSKLKKISVTNNEIIAESGSRIIEVSRTAYAHSLTG